MRVGAELDIWLGVRRFSLGFAGFRRALQRGYQDRRLSCQSEISGRLLPGSGLRCPENCDSGFCAEDQDVRVMPGG